MGTNPTALTESGLYLPSFGGAPWAPTASAGGSGANGNLLSSGSAPAVGTAVNSLTPATWNGTAQWLTTANPTGTYWTANGAGSGWLIANVTVNPADSGVVTNNPAFLSDGGGSFQASFSSSGFVMSVYDGAYQGNPAILFDSGVWLFFQFAWSPGGTIWARVNNGNPQTTALGTPGAFGAGALLVGTNFSAAVFTSMSIMAVGTSLAAETPANFAGVGAWWQDRLGLDFGFLPPMATYPDHAHPRFRHDQRHRIYSFLSQSQRPEQKIAQALAQYQDIIDPRRGRESRRIHASQQLATAMIRPRNEAVSRLYTGLAVIPDRIVQTERRERGLRTSAQLDTSKVSPLPIPASVLTPVDLARYQDTIPRPQYRADKQSFSTRISPAPERTLSAFDIEYPDTIARPLMRADRQQPAAQDFTHALNAELPRPGAGYALFQDAVTRPKFAAANQIAMRRQIAPERTATLESATYQDTIPRRARAIQLDTSNVSPVPIVPTTTPVDLARYQDTIDRPRVRAANQRWDAADIPHFAGMELPRPGAGYVTYPDAIARPAFKSDRQQPAAQDFAHALNLELQQPAATFPDAIRRHAFKADQQRAFEPSPAPEQTLPLDHQPNFPDRVTRPLMRAADHHVTAMPHAPAPLAQFGAGYTLYPDVVIRPLQRAERQLPTNDSGPSAPLFVVVTPVDLSRYQDRIDRPIMRTVNQRWTADDIAHFTRMELPQPGAGYAVYPDTIARPLMRADRQLDTSNVTPRPEQTFVLDHQPSYQDRVTRPAFPAWQQQPEASRWALPIGLQTLTAAAYYQDAVRRPFVPASVQPVWFSINVLPLPTLAVIPVDLTRYPDRLPLPLAARERQLDTSNVQPLPIVLPQPGAGYATYPDAVARPLMRADRQLDTSNVTPRPEQRIDLGYQATFPDRVTRALQAVVQQPTFTISMRPEQTIPLGYQATFPDSIARPTFRADRQLPTTNIAPAPEQTIPLGYQATFPDRIVRALQPAITQPVFAWSSFTPFSPTDLARYPDRVERARVHASQQKVTQITPIQPELKQSLAWAPAFPDRIERPRMNAARQQTTATSQMPPVLTSSLLWYPSYPSYIPRAIFITAAQMALEWTPRIHPYPPPPFPPRPVAPPPSGIEGHGSQLVVTAAGSSVQTGAIGTQVTLSGTARPQRPTTVSKAVLLHALASQQAFRSKKS